MQQPQVIFLDAVGTLFGVRGTVGEIYGQLAWQAGITVDSVALNRAFIESFRAAPRAAFPGVHALAIPAYEFAWWQAIAARSFERVGVLNQFSDFNHFFNELFAYFATAAPWYVYTDVRQALEYWQAKGIELGVISNFDSRLYQVLEVLDLADFFATVTLSTAVGFAKPDQEIFAAALEKHHCPAAAAWHIGDSWAEDYQGALAVGLRAIWLKRELDDTAKQLATEDAILTLSALLPAPPA
jgi:putative hydrolase of the HAD superfamily